MEIDRDFIKQVKSGWDNFPLDHMALCLPIKGRIKPYDHQIRGYVIGRELPKYGLFFDPGLGKTLVAISIFTYRMFQKQVEKILVVAPLSVVAVWGEEISKYGVTGDMPIHILDGGKVEQRRKVFQDSYQWRKDNPGERLEEIIVVNYDVIARLEEDIIKWKPDMIILDESQAIKNRKADRTKAVWKIGKDVPYKLLLTGTPITESPLDFWSQYKFLDQNIFGKNFTKFREQYAVMGGYGGFQIKRYQNLKQLARMAYSIGYRVSKDKAIGLPEKVDVVKYCYLSKEAEKLYREMERDRLIKFLGGSDANAPIILTAILRMRQVTGGFLKREDGSYVNTGREKLNLLEEVLEELPKGKKLLIFASFTPEIKAIMEVVKKSGRKVAEISGATKTAHRKEIRHQFQETEAPEVLVIQIGVGGLGITLTAADTAIFYSHDPSFEKNIQAKGRIDRIGQKRSTTFIHLLTKNTIDELIYQAIQDKQDLFTLVMDKFLTPEEVKTMSKKHSKKSKNMERRVPPTQQEDQEMVERLSKLKNKIEESSEEGGIEEVTKKSKKKAKASEVVVEKKAKKAEAENLVTVKDLAQELGISPTALRKKLRSSGLDKPSGRWEWPEGHEDIEVIMNFTDDDEETPKPKKDKKAKAPKVQEEVEEVEEDEEDEEDDLDEDDEELEDFEYSDLAPAELKELCRERDIKVTKKTSVDDMIEALIDWDNETFDDDEDEE